MNASSSEVFRVVRGRYRGAIDEDIDDGVEAARIAVWEAQQQGVVIRCEKAFSICVAVRYVGSTMHWRAKHIYPDQGAGVSWQAVESQYDTLATEDHSSACLDAEMVLHESPPQYAHVLRLHYLEGRTLEDIARELGTTAACVRKRHERALKWARAHFVSDTTGEPV